MTTKQAPLPAAGIFLRLGTIATPLTPTRITTSPGQVLFSEWLLDTGPCAQMDDVQLHVGAESRAWACGF